MKTRSILCCSAVLSASALLVPTIAQAQEERRYGDDWRAQYYPIEIEPHFSFGAENVYGASGVGAGLRVGVPFVGGHIGDVPDNLAISFGGDILHYDNCYYGTFCSANYLMVPVALQWNVRVARPVSLFAEGGVFFYKGWFDECGPGTGPGCNAPSDLGVLPTFAVGARIHLARNAALAIRLGYPTTTIGLSFM